MARVMAKFYKYQPRAGTYKPVIGYEYVITLNIGEYLSQVSHNCFESVINDMNLPQTVFMKLPLAMNLS